MSELSIDAALAEDLDCEVGDEISITVTGTVTEKSKEGGKKLNVTEVSDYEHVGGEYDEEVEKTAGKRKGGPSAVMLVMGKGK